MNCSRNPNGSGEIGIILTPVEARLLKSIVQYVSGGKAETMARRMRAQLSGLDVIAADQFGDGQFPFIQAQAGAVYKDKP